MSHFVICIDSYMVVGIFVEWTGVLICKQQYPERCCWRYLTSGKLMRWWCCAAKHYGDNLNEKVLLTLKSSPRETGFKMMLLVKRIDDPRFESCLDTFCTPSYIDPAVFYKFSSWVASEDREVDCKWQIAVSILQWTDKGTHTGEINIAVGIKQQHNIWFAA